jgi:hypothetical protein
MTYYSLWGQILIHALDGVFGLEVSQRYYAKYRCYVSCHHDHRLGTALPSNSEVYVVGGFVESPGPIS